METRRKVLTRVGAIALLTLSLFYMVKLVSLMTATQRAAQAEGRIAAEVTAVESGNLALEADIIEAESDAYAESWARDVRKWAREGDHPVAPVSATETPGAGASASPSDDDGAWNRFKHWLSGG